MISNSFTLAGILLPLLLWLLFTAVFFVVLYYVIKRAVLSALCRHAAESPRSIEDDLA